MKRMFIMAAILACFAAGGYAQDMLPFGGADRVNGQTTNRHQGLSRSVVFPNGNSYMGEMLNDRFHGEGTFLWTDGSYYTGSWKMGKQSGFGKYGWPTGHRYEGRWFNGLKEGE